MTIVVAVPGQGQLQLKHLLLDVNGTLTDRGRLLEGVQPRIRQLRSHLDIRLLSADTFGNLDDIADQLGHPMVERVATGADKAALANELGATECAAIGNGANDEPMLNTVALGIAVLGPEGASPRSIAAADILTPTIGEALDLLAEPKALAATLRA